MIPDSYFEINQPFVICWFRRDLRLNDQTALYHALQSGFLVLPLFMFDTQILDKLEDKDDKRVAFIHKTLESIKWQLKKLESDILILHGEPVLLWKQLSTHPQLKGVYFNHDYEPYARQRDRAVYDLLTIKKIAVHNYKDQCILEYNEVLKDDGKPYTVFTPYSRKWKSILKSNHLQYFETENLYGNFLKSYSFDLPPLASMGFTSSNHVFPDHQVPDTLLKKYGEKRNFPGLQGTSRLGVHLRFGTISVRQLAKRAYTQSETFLNELIWRDFYMMILWHFPHVTTCSFKPEYDRIQWRNHAGEFDAWCKGNTGYPIVDAGMRELNETGFMHNRVRMIVASFLTKHLLIDWRWGEAYFAKKLLDFDLSANNGGWQWAAGSGCDAAPYFRVFNPTLQTEKFDKNLAYIRRWVPEYFAKIPYIPPIVEHDFARNRCLNVYSKALKKV